MTAAITKGDVKHIQDVLHPDPNVRLAQQRTIAHLVELGGETTIKPTEMKPASIAMLNHLQIAGLIDFKVISDLEIVQRVRVRLTDHGRKLATYLEQMRNNQVVNADSINLDQLERIAGKAG